MALVGGKIENILMYEVTRVHCYTRVVTLALRRY
jgi:hypothetical protein